MRFANDPRLSRLQRLMQKPLLPSTVDAAFAGVQFPATPESHAIVAARLYGPHASQTEGYVAASTDPRATRALLPSRARTIPPRAARMLGHVLKLGAATTGALSAAIVSAAAAQADGLPVIAGATGTGLIAPGFVPGVRLPLPRAPGAAVQRYVFVDRDMATFCIAEQPVMRRGRLEVVDSANTTWRGVGELDRARFSWDVLNGKAPFSG